MPSQQENQKHKTNHKSKQAKTRKQQTNNKNKQTKQKQNNQKTPTIKITTSNGDSCIMTSCVSWWEWPLTRSKTKNHNKNARGQVRGCKKQQSSMQKPGIPEITKSSRSGMTFTLTLRSKHRQRRVATKVVRKERTVKQEGETWSSVKMTAKATALSWLRYS